MTFAIETSTLPRQTRAPRIALIELVVQRLLPAVATVEYDPTLNQCTHVGSGKCWTLRLSNPRKRHVAGLKLPLVDVAMTFAGYTEAEIDPVIERFFSYFRRGGD